MSGTIDKELLSPILADEKLIRALEAAIQDARMILIDEIASFLDIRGNLIARFLQKGVVPEKQDKAFLYTKAIGYLKPEYTVKWKDDVTGVFHDVETMIAALTREQNTPYSLQVRMGAYTVAYIQVTIVNTLVHTAHIRVVSNLAKVREIFRTFKSVLSNSAPELGVLHHVWFKLFLSALGWGGFMAAIFATGYSSASIASGSIALSVAILAIAVGLAAGYAATQLYHLIFPPVVFDFGTGRKHGGRKRMFLAALGLFVSISLAVALS